MTDIQLVFMPFGPVEWPSSAIGQLLGACRRAGLSARSTYPALEFAARIGFPQYALLSGIITTDTLLQEWVFSRAAFGYLEQGEDLPRSIMPDDSFLGTVTEFLLGHATPEQVEKINRIFRVFYDEQGRFTTAEFYRIREEAGSFTREAAEKIAASGARIVGCTTTYQQYTSSLALTRALKAINPEIVTFLGGAACEGEMGEVTARNFPWLDFVVSGEGDVVFPDLCAKILSGGLSAALKDIPTGVFTTHQPQGSRENGGRGNTVMVGSMDETTLPEYDDFFSDLEISGLREEVKPVLVMETSRGCWKGFRQPCSFCGLNAGRKAYRPKAPQRVIEEMDILARRHGINSFMMTDTILNMNLLDTALAELARRGAPYKIFFETASTLDEAQVKRLAAAGVLWIQPGIESLHDEILALMNKGNSAIVNVALLIYALENGVHVVWNLLCNIPGDRDGFYSEMAAFFPLLFHLIPPRVVKLRYDRFSEYHRCASQYGITLTPLPTYAKVYPFSPDDLDSFALFFEETGGITSRKSKNPGYGGLTDVAVDWRKRFYSEDFLERPTLQMDDTDGVITIVDNRPGRLSGRFSLTGLQRDVYLACRAPKTRDEVAETVCRNQQERDEAAIYRSLDWLAASGLLLEINRACLALANFKPVRELQVGARRRASPFSLNSYDMDADSEENILWKYFEELPETTKGS